MTAFQNHARARDRLCAVTAEVDDREGHLDDGARICAFLRKAGPFNAARADVSALIRSVYTEWSHGTASTRAAQWLADCFPPDM